MTERSISFTGSIHVPRILVLCALVSTVGCGPAPSSTDAGPVCGDGTCAASEDVATCAVDCGAVCGDGFVAPPEECDPPNATDCDMVCRVIPPPPPPPIECGNDVVDPGEQCDPPNATTCNDECQMVIPNSVPVGGPCTLDSECMGAMAPAFARCLTEADNEWPGGFCVVEDCTPIPGGGSDCPAGSSCVLFTDGSFCFPDCTPSPTSNGGCRSDVLGDFSYACIPSVVEPLLGYCSRGCENDAGCNQCLTAGTCGNDPDFPCMADADCLMASITRTCNTNINLCHPDHPAGPADIGDPCTGELDCPSNASCLGADGTSARYPGGFCSSFYCETYASLPEFQCAGTGICPSTEGFLGGQWQQCAAPCTVDPAAPFAECDGNRGDAFMYACLETAAVTTIPELFDTLGAPGFCYQCDELFESATGCP